MCVSLGVCIDNKAFSEKLVKVKYEMKGEITKWFRMITSLQNYK